MSKQSHYDTLRHQLDSDMLRASSLPTEPERRGFVNRTFVSLHKAYQEKRLNYAEYCKLVNRLAAYRNEEYNDYIDVLMGAASMGMLELAIQGELLELSPEAARERSKTITDITGVEPVKPEREEEK